MKLAVLAVLLAVPPSGKHPHPKPPAPPPALTEVEKLKLENLQLKFSMLSEQQKQLQGEYSALVQGITSEHPGYRWDPQTSTLIALPPEKKPEPAE